MSNLINNVQNWVASAGSLVLIIVLAYSAFKSGKVIGILLGFFGGCIGLYLLSNPTQLYNIGKELTNLFLEG
jgi:xanthine/uracil permease